MQKIHQKILGVFMMIFMFSPLISSAQSSDVDLIVTIESHNSELKSCLGQNTFVCTLFLTAAITGHLTVTNPSTVNALNITATIAPALQGNIVSNVPGPGCANLAPNQSCTIDLVSGFTPMGPISGNYVKGSNTNPSFFNIQVA